ncbi:hypothetical protein [Caballeronia sp. dw_276]|jgi:hypothetical protein|uniref:hypothetical protein n=1 Tax=Caballeronia sp. dw_276 TaxID=2719795 RepID=UPI001BD44D69|nr:hypothetical protein [Caballeronia sp. dw_276]
MKLYETALNARILQSVIALSYRKTPIFPADTVTNAFNLSRKVTACADSCLHRRKTAFHRVLNRDARKQQAARAKSLHA